MGIDIFTDEDQRNAFFCGMALQATLLGSGGGPAPTPTQTFIMTDQVYAVCNAVIPE